MFYENQPEAKRESYKRMLEIIGKLTLLFSESKSPYLPYRFHENVFCKYFEAVNLGRKDCSADAKKDCVGIGLKTWVDNDDQKVAEFGKLRPEYEDLHGIDLIKKISEYRNERIRITKNLYDINKMIYHIVKRIPGAMIILEHAFDCIDIDNITLLEDKGNANNIYFEDGNHTYHFSLSKNTLYMIFSDLEELDRFPVSIIQDPYSFLMTVKEEKEPDLYSVKIEDREYDIEVNSSPAKEKFRDLREHQICLRLYTINKSTKEKFVATTSGINQWNGVRTSNQKRADGTVVHIERQRNANELYIPYPAQDRRRNPNFFPPRDTPFKLHLPDGNVISAKVCQEAHKRLSEKKYNMLSEAERAKEDARRKEGKAIMSNPNKVLGEWLLRKVFELPEGTVVTYPMLMRFGIDSVIFTKINDLEYSIDFSEIGTYESFYEIDTPNEEEE